MPEQNLLVTQVNLYALLLRRVSRHPSRFILAGSVHTHILAHLYLSAVTDV